MLVVQEALIVHGRYLGIGTYQPISESYYSREYFNNKFGTFCEIYAQGDMLYTEVSIPFKVALNPIAITSFEDGDNFYGYVLATHHNFEEN